MKIEQSRIRSLSRYLPGLQKGRKFRVARLVEGTVSDALQRIGFPASFTAGDALIPKGIGPVSEFNANGREIVRNDLPKEKRSFTVYTTWNDWHGHPHSGFQHRSIDAFPIQNVPGPTESLTIAEKDGQIYAVSRVLTNNAETEAENLHVINLYLEIFGQCIILDENISLIALPAIRSLNWRVLPKGKYPWDKAKAQFEAVTSHLPEDKRKVVEDRLRFISGFNPDFLAVGEGGFSGYFVLGFSGKPLFVFESIHLGNATYVFDKNWEAVSKLSKGEILKNNLHKHRLVHGLSWRQSVRSVL